jgi:serine/threonine-protein kinase RsbW
VLESPRSEATRVAIAVSPGGHGDAVAVAPYQQSSATPMLYFGRMANEAQLQLLSRYENIELAEHMLGELAVDGRIEEETLYWVSMALREAVSNAIRHGNKLNPDKRVFVSMTVAPPGRLEIAVEDEGEGFDPAALEDPTSPENILRQSGRGVFYMRHFMDEVRFSQSGRGGTRVELFKNMQTGRSE